MSIARARLFGGREGFVSPTDWHKSERMVGGRAVTSQQCSKPKEKMEQLMGGKFPKRRKARACVARDAWGSLLSADPLG